MRQSGAARRRRPQSSCNQPPARAAAAAPPPLFELHPLERRIFLTANPEVSGPAAVNEAVNVTANYTLDLLANSDATVTGWTINWGDGNTESVSGNPSSVTHVYRDGNAVHTINASVTDTADGGTTSHSYPAAPLTVSVNNVAPALALSGSFCGPAVEGSWYQLNINSPDPGDDTLQALSIDWGDGDAATTLLNPSRTGASASHQYREDGAFTITVTAVDGDGSYQATRAVPAVANVPPALLVSRPPAANEGSSYALNVASADPGPDTINSWTVDWGDGTTETVPAPRTVRGSGADIWGAADQFHYAYRRLIGDGSIVARVASMDDPGNWARAGVMIRQDPSAGSPNALMALAPSGKWDRQYRATAGGATTATTGSGTSVPYWIKLTRVGSSFTGYTSPDGVNWTQRGSAVTVAMPAGALIGLAVSSYGGGGLPTAQHRQVREHHDDGGGVRELGRPRRRRRAARRLVDHRHRVAAHLSRRPGDPGRTAVRTSASTRRGRAASRRGSWSRISQAAATRRRPWRSRRTARSSSGGMSTGALARAGAITSRWPVTTTTARSTARSATAPSPTTRPTSPARARPRPI